MANQEPSYPIAGVAEPIGCPPPHGGSIPATRHVASDPGFKIPTGGYSACRDVEPRQERDIAASGLLAEDRRCFSTISIPAQGTFSHLSLFCLTLQAGIRHRIETIVQPALQQQCLVRATLHQTPLIEHDDLVGVFHR